MNHLNVLHANEVKSSSRIIELPPDYDHFSQGIGSVVISDDHLETPVMSPKGLQLMRDISIQRGLTANKKTGISGQNSPNKKA